MAPWDGNNPLWKLPVLQTPDLGKLGPGFGYGIGCGVGLGVGLVGGAGLGLGFPGLQFGAGVGVGCGIGIGFGYGLGRGRAYDDQGRHNNVGPMLSKKGDISAGAEIGAVVDNLVSGLKQAFESFDKGIGKKRS